MHSIGWNYLIFLKLKKAEQYLLNSWELSKHKEAHPPMNLGHVKLLEGNKQKAMSWYQQSLALWRDKELFFAGMQSDYIDLKMEERGISKNKCDMMIEELKES